jgi:uncharacterized protein YdbL (DUF1318 family)
MAKRSIAIFVALLVAAGCASVSVRAPKEPIKVDISMRLDIYQHVQQDIDEIESLVSGGGGSSSLIDPFKFFVGVAYAQGGLSAGVKEAALRRKERRPRLMGHLASGVIGENAYGFLEIRKAGQADSTINNIVAGENNDRDLIYKAIAFGNGAPLEGVQTMYAARLQNDAPAGTPVQSLDRSTNRYEWRIK